jgi:putative hydrolase of the HAD superfamily
MISAVVFDLDGVVRHFDPAHVAEIERRHEIPEGAIEAFAFARPHIDEVTTGRISRADWVERIAQHLGNAAAAAEWGTQPSRVDPDILELAGKLRAAGLVTAILTNGTDTIPTEAIDLDLPGHFDAIFNSASIGYAKPDVRAFTHVLEHLGLLGEEVFFVDDSEVKLQGARACGMLTHHFTGIDPLRAALARERIPSLGAVSL